MKLESHSATSASKMPNKPSGRVAKAPAHFPLFLILLTIVLGIVPWFVPIETNSGKFQCTLLMVIIGLLIRQDGHQSRLVAQWDNPEIDIDVHHGGGTKIDEEAIVRIINKVIDERKAQDL